MIKICVIGGSGFVGTRLIEFLETTYSIKILDKNISKKFPELTIIGDIRDKNFLVNNLKNFDLVILLAAEHRDDVSPISLYYDVNVSGTQNVIEAINKNDIKNIIFTSSVAVYGLNKNMPNEKSQVYPFSHYGKSKWQAEKALRNWYNENPIDRSLTIIRPTVIFGERNRGNVYNLLKQISSGRFMMVGKGTNKKSMAYVGNIVAFIKYCIESQKPGYRLYNYIDKPDLCMNELVQQVETSLNKKLPPIRIPYWLGYLGGLSFDLLAKVICKKLTISSVRVKKFCATTQFDATAAHDSGFKAPFSLAEGLHRTLHYEFINPNTDEDVFESE